MGPHERAQVEELSESYWTGLMQELFPESEREALLKRLKITPLGCPKVPKCHSVHSLNNKENSRVTSSLYNEHRPQ